MIMFAKGFLKALTTCWILVSVSFYGCGQTGGVAGEYIGNGFVKHGLAVPYASSRGTVALTDKDGHDKILIWLYDHRGTYSLLMIDADLKETEQFFLPFTGISYTSLLSKNNRYYTHFDGHFIEFDPSQKKFTFIGKTPKGTAMSMTEDKDGLIWAALRPNSNLISYNPRTRKLVDHGVLYKQKSRQQCRSIAVDDNGWVYVTVGSPGKEIVVSYNPETKKSQRVQMNIKSIKGRITISETSVGNVYVRSNGKNVASLYRGEKISFAKKSTQLISKKKTRRPISGDQSLFHRVFSDGSRIKDWVSASSLGFLRDRKVRVENSKSPGEFREVTFDYKTEGAFITGLIGNSEGLIVGGSMFPMLSFSYNPIDGKWVRRSAGGQYNTFGMFNNKLLVGTYPDGKLVEVDIKSGLAANKANSDLAKVAPYITRPLDLMIYPQSDLVIMAGKPAGSMFTGGLLIYNTKTQSADVIKRIKGLSNQSTNSLAPLPNARILGGTTVSPGESGQIAKAEEACLYIMDLHTHKVIWSGVVLPGVKSYQDLCLAPNGMIMGVADRNTFFVFDPTQHKVLRKIDLVKKFGAKIPFSQGQRVFITGPEDEMFLLLTNGIVKIDPENIDLTLLAKAPVEISGGGAYLDDRIYFFGNNRTTIYSYLTSGTKK